jgi:CrcB protein
MLKVALIGVAGAAGALARYGIGVAVGVRSFPWATLGINLAGCLVLGFVLAGPARRWSPTTTAAVGVGFLGAFTTYSTFANETDALWRAGRGGAAAAYVAVSIVGGLAAAAAGYALGRRV